MAEYRIVVERRAIDDEWLAVTGVYCSTRYLLGEIIAEWIQEEVDPEAEIVKGNADEEDMQNEDEMAVEGGD